MKKLIVLTLVLTVIFSCRRHPTEKTCITDVSSISGTYKITAYTYKASASSPEIDYYNTVFPDPCNRDNDITFNANGTYQVTDAGIVCSPPDDEIGPWTLVGSTLEIDGISMTVESFDCKKLVLGYTGLMGAGDKAKITFIKK